MRPDTVEQPDPAWRRPLSARTPARDPVPRDPLGEDPVPWEYLAEIRRYEGEAVERTPAILVLVMVVGLAVIGSIVVVFAIYLLEVSGYPIWQRAWGRDTFADLVKACPASRAEATFGMACIGIGGAALARASIGTRTAKRSRCGHAGGTGAWCPSAVAHKAPVPIPARRLRRQVTR
jgi:hypothetical protein